MELSYEAAQSVTEHTGFPNPATDSNIVSLNLAKMLIKHPASTFFMEVDSNAWEHRGVYKGDYAIVDKALMPRRMDLVIWWDESDFIISPYHQLPLGTKVWGVITSIIHRYRP